MSGYIDADTIEKEGWYMQRIRQEDSKTMVLETKKPSEFSFVDVVKRKKGEWISHYDYCKKYGYIPSGLISLWWCNQCEQGAEHPTNFCPNCGADMRGEGDE